MPPRCERQMKVNSKQFTATFKVGNKIKTSSKGVIALSIHVTGVISLTLVNI